MPESALTFERYFFWLVVYSMIGWVYESLLESFRQKKLVNRGFLNGPYLPIYGSGALLDVVILGWIQYPVILFLASSVITCTLEFFASVLMEKLFHIRWWDYNDFKFHVFGKTIDMGKFNIQGRICLAGFIAFGTLSIALVYYLHPIMVYLTDMIPFTTFQIIFAIMFAVVIVDILFTVSSLAGFHDQFDRLTKTISRIKTNTVGKVQSTAAYEKINAACEKFVKTMNPQQIRIFRTFTQLRSTKHPKTLERIKKIIFRRKNKINEEETNEHSADLSDNDLSDNGS